VEKGYAVLFLHRKNSLQPYVRHCMQHGTNFFEFLELGPDGQAQGKLLYINLYNKNHLLIMCSNPTAVTRSQSVVAPLVAGINFLSLQ
jgi:hypothetical protein